MLISAPELNFANCAIYSFAEPISQQLTTWVLRGFIKGGCLSVARSSEPDITK
jgi:hypothetical protein